MANPVGPGVGFGGALTDSSAWLISAVLSAEMHRRVMHDLFDPGAGIGLSYVRVAIGASDFAREHYTYDDLTAGQTDPGLVGFSIEHDRAYIFQSRDGRVVFAIPYEGD